MKNLLIVLIATFTTLSVNGQKSIDDIFDYCSNNSDYTVIRINRAVTGLMGAFSEEEVIKSITGIRIIARNETSIGDDSFYEKIMDEVDFSDYEELIRIKESNKEELIVYVVQGKRYINELLLIAEGEGDALIQITGKMSLDEAKQLAEEMNTDLSVSIN